MRVAAIRVIQVRIPLKKRIRHASHSRTENDTVLVRCQLEDGTVGWGEGLPRAYVTGETIETAWQHLQDYPYATLGQKVDSLASLADLVTGLSFSRPRETRECFGNAARCALELALLDAGCRGLGVPVSSFLEELSVAQGMTRSPVPVDYSAVLTASSLSRMCCRSLLYRYYGFRQCKVKVGMTGSDARKLLMLIHRLMGSRAALRVDANEAWTSQNIAKRLAALNAIPLQSVEQPVPHAEVECLRDVRRQIVLPIMLDESLCSKADADRAIEGELCDAFNLRLSKCGGIVPCVLLMQQARRAGLFCQLGCQVGETGILSAAGRHFAGTMSGLTAVEGSFDRLLVREPLTEEDLTFGRGGLGKPLPGIGLGITIQQAALQRVTVQSKEFSVS